MPALSVVPAKLHAQRIAKTKNEAEFIALRTSILRGDHINREGLELALRDVMLAIKQIVESSKLAQAEKVEILQNLATIPNRIEQVRRDQTRAIVALEASETNGGGQN